MACDPLPGILSTTRSDRGIGFVDYIESNRSIPFWCRRGVGEVLAYIYCPVALEWEQRHAWALDCKSQITAMIIEHFRREFPASTVRYDTEAIVVLRKAEPKSAEPFAFRNPA
jgi:hypothetical protein